MTNQGFLRRLYALEWHVRLCRQNGAPLEWCEQAVQVLGEQLDADCYGEARPPVPDFDMGRIQAYLDRIFTSESLNPDGTTGRDFYA